MKTVQFTNIYLEHFGKHENIQSELGHRVLIEGANATGKSTIKRAIQYILGAKDENGKEISGIRPHDENGVDIDGLTTIAELGISVDGLENTLKRICFQEKNRQGEYTGKDNLQYFVDDVKKGTKKAYDEFISSFLPNMVCISAQELLTKDTAGRRAMLEVFHKHDIDSIIDENPDCEPLRAKLKANTVTDLKKTYRDKIKVKTKERDAYPARIDEIEKQKVDIDVAKLELLKNSLNEKIKENKAKQEDISKEFEERQKASDGILELKFELNDLQRKANEELDNKRRKLRRKINDICQEIKELNKQIGLNDRDIGILEEYIRKHTAEIEKCCDDWNRISGEEMKEESVVCPTCHREMPEDFRKKYVSEFEKNKKDRLALVSQKGNEMKDRIKQDNAEIEQIKATKTENENEKEKKNEELSSLEKELDNIPQSIDIFDRPEVQEIQKQIAEKEQAMNKGNSAEEIRQKLQEEYESLQRQLNEVEFKFLEAKKNDEIDNNVEKLRKEQRVKSQEIADIEKELDLLKLFERKKAELLESDINSNFNIIQWHMFRKMQNGDLADICSPFVNGTSYDGNLNFSDKLLAEIDICRAFQKLYDIQVPILLDNAESIDRDRIPDIPNQLILFKRVDNKELIIECLEG